MDWVLLTAIITMIIAGITLNVTYQANKSSDKTLKLTEDLKELYKKNLDLLNENKKINQQSLEITKDNLNLTKSNLKREEELKKKETLSQIDTVISFFEKVKIKISNSHEYFKKENDMKMVDITGFESIESIIEKPPLNTYHGDIMNIKSVISSLNHESQFYSLSYGTSGHISIGPIYTDSYETDEQKNMREDVNTRYLNSFDNVKDLLKNLESLKENF